MAQFKDTPSVEKKFKDVFERSPGAFPEGTSLEEKVDRIAKGTKAIKAIKDKEVEGKMKNVAELNKELQRRQRQENEEIRKLTRSTQELVREFGINKRSKPDVSDEPLQETKQASIQTNTQSSIDIGVQTSITTKSSGKLKQNDTPKPQENQKEEGLLSLLGNFLKKILEKLFGEDRKSVEDIKGTAQKSTSDDEGQQKNKLFDNILSQDQSISEGLKQATRLDNPSATPINTPEVGKTNTGRGI